MPKQRVPRTRNDGTMTEAQFRGWVRSQLRRMSQRWRPIYSVIEDGKRPVTAQDKKKWGNRIKFVYHCEGCDQYVPRKEITCDHIVPCGSLKDIETEAGPFILRLLCEKDGLRRLCKPCHQEVTNEQTKEKS